MCIYMYAYICIYTYINLPAKTNQKDLTKERPHRDLS